MGGFAEQVTIERPPHEVWSVLADFGNVEAWAPFVVRSYVTTNGDLGVGSRRILEHRLGFLLDEAVTEWDEGSSFSYAVFGAPFPLMQFQESWSIEPTPSGATLTTRMSYGVRFGPVGALIDWLVIRHLLRRAIKKGHRGLKRHVEATRQAHQIG